MNKARWNTTLTALAVAGLAAALLQGCAARTPHRNTPPKPAVLTASQITTLRALSGGDTAFGLNLLAAVCHADLGANLVLSPLSVTSSLGLAYLGARGGTAAEMANVMKLPHVSQGTLIADLRDRGDLLGTLDRPGVTFAEANRIWADPSLRTKRSYARELRNAYRTTLTPVPLLSDPGQATSTINAAIDKETRGHIPHLLPTLQGTTGWVLTNALYLKAAWAAPFDPSQTKAGPFYASSGRVSVSYLNGSDYKVASDGGWTAASLPYKGNRLQMLALLPPEGFAQPVGSGQLAGHGCPLPSSAEITALENRLQGSQQTSAIALPKVKLSWSGSLKQELTALGMGSAFTAKANFSGISTQACCIGFVQHAATLQVSEKGTVASAATATGISASAAQAPGHPLTFNRPYLILIEDSRTGEPLMFAWVANPAASS
ncbi:MAG TPA: serpin family protein [Streptosporangiaceae bacterium]|nr:serpin family protein [Streptosporangiaceae bacterium]